MTKLNHYLSDANLPTKTSKSGKSRIPDKWEPGTPFHVSQTAFRKHIHEIEKGSFIPLDEGFKRFEQWKERLMESRL